MKRDNFINQQTDFAGKLARPVPSLGQIITVLASGFPFMKTEIKGKGIKVELDTNEIYPQDPGQGTPVLVVLSNGNTGTWNCVTCEGEIDGEPLTDDHKQWLDSITPRVESWMSQHGV